MRSKRRKFGLKVLALSIAVMMVASSAVVYSVTNIEKAMAEGSGSDTFSLAAPPFIEVASAAEVEGGGGGVAAAGTSYLEDEAGISAYTNVEETIDLADAKTAFRTIEHETAEYIIGSVPLPGYAETEDVHAYVHTDGWVVAYYLEAEPAAKIVDWESYSTAEIITGTKLEDGVSVVCNAAGVPIRNLKYYDFRYQNANRLMIVADALWDEGTDTFNIKLPSDLSFYERSFSLCFDEEYGTGYSYMYIDDVEISYLATDGTNYGLLSSTQLSLDDFHTIKISAHYPVKAFDAIVLVYREV
jgi:hypothetical protein